MDSNRRYGWKTHNFVFDNNLNKYVEKQSQHRTNRFVDFNTAPVNNNVYSSSRNTECIAVGNHVNKHQQNRPVSQPKIVKHKAIQNKDKRRRAKKKAKSKPLTVSMHQNNKLNNSTLNIQVPSHNEYIILTHHYITLILCNWHRIYKYKPSASVMSYLMTYTIQRFEFDEFHPLIQTWLNYNMDDDISMDSTQTTPKTPIQQKHISASMPIQLIKSQTSDNDVDEVQCLSEDSLSISTNDVPFIPYALLTPSVSASVSVSVSVSAAQSEAAPVCMPKMSKHHNNYQCTASLPNVKWSTIFFGPILNSNLLHKNTYVCNVKINKLGYGVGFAFFGHNDGLNDNDNDIYYNGSKLNTMIQDKYQGYPDKIENCFVVYDDGEFCDWDNTQNNNNKHNVNDLPDGYANNSAAVKLISKLSKVELKTTKSKQFSLSPSITPTTNLSVRSDEENNKTKSSKKVLTRSKSKKDFYANAKQKRVPLPRSKSDADRFANITNTSHTRKKYNNLYGRRPKNRSKAKRITEKFGFDEKTDIIQISLDLYHKKISIHNINNHRCIVIKNFNYDLMRMAFVLRYSNITVIDQKWV